MNHHLEMTHPVHTLYLSLVIQDEAHFIKTRSSQTANAAFSLIGIHRWALSGTPLQNRVGMYLGICLFMPFDPFQDTVLIHLSSTTPPPR